MKKEKSLAEKIKSYSTLAASILAVAKTADAQVIYTDVMPDDTIHLGIYSLDLNNDGVTDFNLAQVAATSTSSSSSSSFNGVTISPIGENAFINKPDTVSISSYQIPFPSPDILNLNDLIKSNCVFVATGITPGSILEGVKYVGNRIWTNSCFMRSESGTVRFEETWHGN